MERKFIKYVRDRILVKRILAPMWRKGWNNNVIYRFFKRIYILLGDLK